MGNRNTARRHFLTSMAALGAGTVLPGCAPQPVAPADPRAERERNKTVARSYLNAASPADRDRLLARDYRQSREGFLNLTRNAEGQNYADAGPDLRIAIPDRRNVLQDIIAEGNQVGLLYRITGTHQAPLFGIPATGRKLDVLAIAILTVEQGLIRDGWFLADETGLLKQLGQTRLPSRQDGRLIVPPITGQGLDGDAMLRQLTSRPVASQEDRNRLVVAQSKSSKPPAEDRGSGYKQLRQGFQHLRDYGVAKGVAKETPTLAMPDRRDFVDGFIAEGDKVWMQFRIAGTQTGRLYGHPGTGKRVEMPEIGIATFRDGKWVEGWYFGDELGMMLQLGALQMLG